MRVLCGTCQTFVDVDDPMEVEPAKPYVCGACKAEARGRRSMQLDFDDGATPKKARPPAMPVREPIADPESVDPVSIQDLEMILAPGVEPPPIAGTPHRRAE